MSIKTFDPDTLAQLIYKDQLPKWLKTQEIIAKDPILQNHVSDYGLSRKKLYEIYSKKAQRLHKVLNYSEDSIPGLVNSQFPETIVTVLHQTMFIPTIKNLGTEKQIEKWIPMCVNCEIIGCYAQTELGHGSDVQNLETTAVYDKNTEEFILNTPTVSATKWWIGDLGFTATHAVTHAQLFIDGKHYGVQTFLIQVRDLETHLLLPGIEAGDIGAKYGYNTKDNGYLRMKNIRIPRENMLMRYNKVSKAGEFIKSQNEKIGYATMMQVRLSIIMNTFISLAQGLSIAVTYSNFRKQFKDQNHIERPIIDYQTQQDKIIPLMADCFGQMFGFQKIQEILTENLRRINEKMDFSLMGDLHAQLCCCKAIYTWTTHYGLDKLRQSLGGHGFLLSSGIATVQTEFSPCCTYEGENTVLLLQTARYLLKAINKANKNMPINENVEYLHNIQLTLQSKAQITRKEQLFCPEIVRKLVRFNAAFQVNKALNQMMEKGGQFGPKDAWNKYAGIALTDASVAHTYYWTTKVFLDGISKINDEGIRNVLSNLCCLYGLQKIIDWPTGYFQGGFLNGEQLELILEAKESLLEMIKPELSNLVQSFKFHENTLRSDLVHPEPYQKLLSSAKQSSVNDQVFQDKLNETLQQIQGKPRL